jgi:hypothetical protein
MSKKFHIKAFILVFMISICSILSACNNGNNDYKVNMYNTDIAYFSLFTYSGEGESSYGIVNLGHAFLSIENISEEDIVVYNYTIPAGETVSIGTWCLSNHFGIWFNIESNYIDNCNKYDGRYSITTGISLEDIETIDDFMKDHDKWGALRNCSYFALSLWNEIAEDSEYIAEKPIYTPKYLEEEISKFDTHEINRAINTSNVCSYYNGDKYLEFHFEGDE